MRQNETALARSSTQAPQSVGNLKIKEILDLSWVLVCLYSLSVISGWIQVILSDFLFSDVSLLQVYFSIFSYRETIAQNNPDPPRNPNQWIKTHKEQDKSSISFIFKFPTDWGACEPSINFVWQTPIQCMNCKTIRVSNDLMATLKNIYPQVREGRSHLIWHFPP